ncbi:hypothetical protein FACS189427_05740 [Planctomycetales bacterium]|nr:hypothetical protein FACS1894214_3580 [Planctomycetales bacterium]GHT35740.1 hypothetical protein FACS189427_05740 [Planctomycetales bacterium]
MDISQNSGSFGVWEGIMGSPHDFVYSEPNVRSALERTKKRLLECPDDETLKKRKESWEKYIAEHFDSIPH